MKKNRTRLLHLLPVWLLLLPAVTYTQVSWYRVQSDPVFPASSGNVNDPSTFRYVHSPCVMLNRDPDTLLYRMWFGSLTFGGTGINLSYALSLNGREWYPFSGNPVLRTGEPGSFDSQWITDPFVLKVGDQYELYYTGYDHTYWRGGHATSPDGIHWTKGPGNPLLDVRPGTWESWETGASPKVILIDSSYVMAYTGYDGSHWSIGIARSSDGIHWERDNLNPVLKGGEAGSWDAQGPMVDGFFKRDSMYYIFYSAAPNGGKGLAFSKDLRTWKKYARNPVLTAIPGTWEDDLGLGSFVISGNSIKYWYTAKSSFLTTYGDQWQIGYARSDLQLDSVLSNGILLSAGEQKPLPKEYVLQPAYPNPFNPGTVLNYDIPRGARVRISVFDVMGRVVATLIDEEKAAGHYSVRWNAQGIASGSYWVRMQAGEVSRTQAVVLVK